MPASWLVRKRKGELLELAHQARIPDADGLLKDDLVDALQEALENGEAIYGKSSVFRDFYERSTGSPIKRERASPSDALAVVKQRRRQTLKSTDSDEATPDKALATRTPRAVSRVTSRVSQVDLPASPSQLAEVADQSFQIAKTKAQELWDKTRAEEFIATVRENASSVVVIQLAVLLFESAGLVYNTIAWTHAFTTPPSLYNKPVHLPDASLLLTSKFWAPATLWSLTNWFLPLVFSYFFNLTLRSNTRHKSSNKTYTVDPLTFNIARALLAYIVYYVPVAAPAANLVNAAPGATRAKDRSWGPFSATTVGTVLDEVPGQYNGIQIGSIIGVLVSLYDAALKK
ncbi:hypothetical protein K491DRAFT_697942 [Lophiostoma macrostomum CBS 122681]|uniref:Uncharacterized protein n=1 Tax=Lophiostoma macrostomum CBS 122681 TaxID=1314788 RepID=A0A6A6SP38_9PLEO|nr:hypothetical protein K491DRAFT_697942 [Lophiostoma macrostomum CBS 122681]